MPLVGDAKREYQRQWVAERRASWFRDKSCVDCGSTDALELDHIDPSHKISHKIWSWSWKRIFEEVAKCVVRCKKHHRERSNEQAYNFKHGTSSGYAWYGCRCSLCWSAEKFRRKNKTGH